MIRGTFWQSLTGCALVALLAGCGSDNSTRPITTLPSTVTQAVSRAQGATITTAKSIVNIPANALSQDASITVTDSPTDLPTTANTAGLISSVKITAPSSVSITSGTSLTLTLPYTKANTYPVFAYKVDNGVFTEITASPTASGTAGNKASIPVASFGTYAVYNAEVGSVPGTQQPVITAIAPQENSALYGTVRLRVRNLLSSTATVSATVGGVAVTPTPTIAYTDANATSTGGGAIDLRVPYGLTSGSQSLVVTVNGVASPAYTVKVSNTNPFAVFTFGNNLKFVAELRQDKAPNTVANFIGLATGLKSWTATSGGTAIGSATTATIYNNVSLTYYPIPTTDPTTAGTTIGGVMNTPLYNGVTFHRAQANSSLNFVQTGDPITALPSGPSGWTPGIGGPGYTINFEDTGLTNVAGSLAMARRGGSSDPNDPSGLNTGSSQIFINTMANPGFDVTSRDSNNKPTNGYAVFGLAAEGTSNLTSIAVTESASGVATGATPTKLTSVVITGKLDSQ